MEEVVEKIVEMAKKQAADYGLADQAAMYEEIANRLNTMHDDALWQEYIESGL